MSFPSKFGKYLLLERVNVGGMAEVFKAKTFGAAGFESIRAIKRILPNLVEDEEFIKMFFDEASIALQLHHPNIVQIYELGKHGEHYYISMEYIASRDLRAILDRLRASGQLMPIPQAAYITARTAEGLDYAHRREDQNGLPMNIVHRDVSPQNVLLGYEGEVKVIDFGIAKAANRASKTQAGVLKGKFGYMSPEQVRGLPIDRRSDIFAVGVLLYEMLTGERLFIGESDFSTLERVRNADVIPPTSFNKKISPRLEQIVLKILAREVEDRYQWASELARDLQEFTTDNAGPFNSRRLSMSMKEMYAVEYASERSKLEHFMRINADDIKENGPPQQSLVVPLPRAVLPPGSLPARHLPAPAAQDDGRAEPGEDKTFVIEPGVEELVLGHQVTNPNLAGGGTSKQPTTPPQKMITDHNASGEEGVSLYGDPDSDSDSDEARTLIGAENPFFNPGSASSPHIAPAAGNKAPMALNPAGKPRVQQNVQATPSVAAVPTIAPLPQTRTVPPAKAPVRSAGPVRRPPATPKEPIDPVLAAMMEEESEAPPTLMQLEAPGEDPENFLYAPGPAEATNAKPNLATASDFSPNVLATQEAQVDSVSDDALSPDRTLPPNHLPSALAARQEISVAPYNKTPLFVGLGGTGAFFLGAVVFFLFRLMMSGDQSPAVLELSPVGAPAPIEVSVSLDGKLMGTTLPISIPLPVGVHNVEITGTGMVRVSREIWATGGTMRQPVLITLPAAPIETAGPLKTNSLMVEKPIEALQVVKGGWRLSLAAVGDDGTPVFGAQVLINGNPVGMTPLEAELDENLDTVLLRVLKDGFNTQEINIKRAGRTMIGPATVSLRHSSTAAAQSASTGASTTGATPGATPGATAGATPGAPTGATMTPSSPDAAKTPATTAATTPATGAASVVPPAPISNQQGASTKVTSAGQPPKVDPKKGEKIERPQGEAKKPERLPPAPKALAEIEIGTSPYADTTIDGRRFGSTPFFGPRTLTLPIGTHKVEFFDKQGNKKYNYQFKLKAQDPNNKIVIQFNKDVPPKVEGQVELKKLD